MKFVAYIMCIFIHDLFSSLKIFLTSMCSREFPSVYIHLCRLFLFRFSHQFLLLWKYSINSLTFYLEFSMNPVLGVTTTKNLKNAFSYIQLAFHLLKIARKIQVDYSMTIQSIVLILFTNTED